MIWTARLGVGLVGLFSLLMGLIAVAAPARVAGALGIAISPALGMNTIRADIGAFFLVGALACAGALFRGKRSWLLAPLALYGLAVSGRILGVLVDGPPPGIVQPVMIELICVAFCALGLKKLP